MFVKTANNQFSRATTNESVKVNNIEVRTGVAENDKYRKKRNFKRNDK